MMTTNSDAIPMIWKPLDLSSIVMKEQQYPNTATNTATAATTTTTTTTVMNIHGMKEENDTEQHTRLIALPHRFGKNRDYNNAIQKCWKAQDPDNQWDTLWTSVTYMEEEENDPNNVTTRINKNNNNNNKEKTLYHGYLIRHKDCQDDAVTTGILLLHTGAGPNDMFLLWKAASLVNDSILKENTVVLIVDLFSDPIGWAWYDQEQKHKVCTELLHVELHQQKRPVLEQRLSAAIDLLQKQLCHTTIKTKTSSTSSSSSNIRLAALGWCLGGHAVVELARMRIPQMCVMVTFHGVFGNLPTNWDNINYGNNNDNNNNLPNDTDVDHWTTEILVCHGVDDPFVPPTDLERALAAFQHYGHTTSLLQLKETKHGFTNPAQEFNEDPAFDYHQVSADRAWRQAMNLLRRRLGSKTE